MKQVQFIGSRDKSDFLFYLAHTIANTESRVLIVDTSKAQNYRYAYSQSETDGILDDFQNVEFISGVQTKDNLIQILESSNESLSNYDYIFVDISEESVIENWLTLENNYYVSDNDRSTIMKDVDLINEFIDLAQANSIRRIHFETTYEVAEEYMKFLLDDRVNFVIISEPVEFEINHFVIKQHMQHEHEIPYKRLNKQYKNVIQDIATEICGISYEDLKATTKTSIGSKLSGLFKKSKAETSLEDAEKDLKLNGIKGVK